MIPFYDPAKSYDYNCSAGPFGGFSDGSSYQVEGEPKHNFLGHSVYLPFGIPAGPLPTANFIIAAFKKGFDLPYYKTVRGTSKGCNAFPNVIPVKVDGDLTLKQAKTGLTMADEYSDPIAITNSFGVPSLTPEEWQPDMKKAVESAGKGQVMIASFQGTNNGKGIDAFIEDHVRTAKLVQETGAKIMELNLSCPNEGKAKLLCHDTDMVEKISFKIKEAIGNTPLLLKMSFFPEDDLLRDFLTRLSKIVQGFSMINTIACAVRNKDGEQALPGEGRLVSGICGAPIKWAGVDMVKRSAQIRSEMGGNFVIVGSGGVTKPEDYTEYMNLGADAVTSATGAMWNTDLAKEIKETVL